ncbi:hypothetical protein KR044_008264, partial [Drosophila immigrans]
SAAEIMSINDADAVAEMLRKLVDDMGYSMDVARKALSYADNNLELAIQFLLEGDAAFDGADISDEALQRRNRRRFKQLRHHLMDNPALNEYNIASLMKKTSSAEALREMVANHSVQLLATLQESSDEEDAVAEKENKQ